MTSQEVPPSNGVTNGTPIRNGVSQEETISTDVLIIGAGPSGLTTALLLRRLGITCIALSRHSGTSPTPRAHLFNQRAVEVVRDMGIEETIVAQATHVSVVPHNTWSHSLAGEEYARQYFQGQAPDRKGEFEAASPCESYDLPQMRFEPVMLKEVEAAGAEVWWRTEFVSQEEVDGGVNTVLKERDSGRIRKVRSKYLIGADGARSPVLQSLGIEVDGRQLNTVFNVHIKAELGPLFKNRPGELNWILNPDAPGWSAVGNFRMVRPWSEFGVSMHPAAAKTAADGEVVFEPTHDDIRTRLYQMMGVGKDVVPDIEILSVSRWTINDQVARSYQKGRVFCIGDAAHRHPPINGLGSNTCVGDANNVTWKLAYVLRGLASSKILDSITPERRPVGLHVVRRANAGMRDHRKLWAIIGLDAEERKKNLAIMESASPEGAALRAAWKEVVKVTDRESNALGMQMNQFYTHPGSLTLVDPTDTAPAPDLSAIDIEMHQVVSTYPGFHLPHAWVIKSGQSPRISTLDLCGHGRFTLLTGIGGEGWREQARRLAEKRPGLEVVVVSIGWRQDYHDAYFEWERLRGVEDDGAVLVRPDHFISWRRPSIKSVEPDCLVKVFDQILPAP